MSNSNLSALSIAALKVIAADLDCTLQGDKRKKQSWIDAIEVAQELEALAEPENETEAEWELRASECMILGEVLDEIIAGSDTDDDTTVDDTEPDGSDPDSGDIFGGYGDEDTWDLDDAIADDAKQTIAKRAPSPKKGAVSVAASIACLLIFALTAFCQILAVTIKYTCLLVMLFGRWNPNLDIWYQLTQRAAERKRLHVASA